jgi:OmpA-OmpF porin, OOP family
MKLLVGLGFLGCVMAAGLPAYAAEPDQESAQIMCDLTGDCAQPGPNGVSQPGAAAEPVAGTGHARTSATRGFTFTRQTAGTSTGAGTQTVSQTVVKAPVAIGASDLKLTFMPNSAVLTDPAKSRLAKYASVLQSPRLATRRLRIEGHTDASGSAKANLDLSRRRAQAVADYLASTGVQRTRIDVAGFGSSKPLPGVAPTAPENRRVMAVLL